MKKTFILLLLLVGFVSAQDSTAFFTLKNSRTFQGSITEINDTYLLVDDKYGVLYKTLSTIELKNEKTIDTIQNYVPELEITEKTDSIYLLTFDHIIFKKKVTVDSDTTRVPFYNNPTNISVGMFINTNEAAFGFTLKAGYAKMIGRGFAFGGFLAYSDWSPSSNAINNTPESSSSVATLIELMPILYILPSEFDYSTNLYFQLGVGLSLSSSSIAVNGASSSQSEIGGVSSIIGIGSFDNIKLLGWVSIGLYYHLGYSQKIYTNYISMELGIYL